jgi:hypothetical protein
MEIGLYYICAIAGLILVVGSLFLIWKGRIYVDAETKTVTKVELPLGIKLQTNLPVLAMFIFGALLLGYPVHEIKELQKKDRDPASRTYLNAKLDWPEPLDVDVVAAGRTDVKGEVNLEVPRCRHLFTVTYWARGRTSKVGDEDVRMNGEETEIVLKGPNAKLVQGSNPPAPTEPSRREPDVSGFNR